MQDYKKDQIPTGAVLDQSISAAKSYKTEARNANVHSEVIKSSVNSIDK